MSCKIHKGKKGGGIKRVFIKGGKKK